MQRQRNVDTRKTLTSEVGVEEEQPNHARRGQKPAARVNRQTADEEQAQVRYALEAVARSPEVRAGKIEALRAQIEAGTYQIDRTSLAMKLLGVTEQNAPHTPEREEARSLSEPELACLCAPV